MIETEIEKMQQSSVYLSISHESSHIISIIRNRDTPSLQLFPHLYSPPHHPLLLMTAGMGLGELVVWSALSFTIHLCQPDPDTNEEGNCACPFGIQGRVWARCGIMFW